MLQVSTFLGVVAIVLGLVDVRADAGLVFVQVPALFGLPTSGPYSPTVIATCEKLASRFPSEVILQVQSEKFNAANTYWSAQTAAKPACILRPITHKAAARMLNTLTCRRAEFAIQAGGHSMNPGFSATGTGILFQLAGLNEITISPDKSTVALGPGNRWNDVYTALTPHGITVPGGRFGDVGVGGFSLGGGLSFYIFSHGFSSDNIISYTVAFPTGKIREVTATSDPDLFLALRGSGSPFCLVLRFVYKSIPLLNPQGRVYFDQSISAGSDLPAVLRETTAFNSNKNKDPNSHLIVIVIAQSGEPEVRAVPTIMVHNGFQGEGGFDKVPEVFKPLKAVVEENLLMENPVKALTYENYTAAIGPAESLKGKRQIQMSLTVENPDAEYLEFCVKVLKESFAHITDGSGVELEVVFIPLGPVVSEGKGENVMGVKGDRLFSVSYAHAWVDAELDEEVFKASDEGKMRMEEEAKRRGIWNRWVYLNYAKFGQDPIGSYGEENLELLRRVKRRVDPKGVWGKLVKGGFKIPGME